MNESADGVLVESVVRASFGECVYTLTADSQWAFRDLRLALGSRSLNVAFDGLVWTVNGQERNDLEAAREVDLAFSPLSNTLPIRRLHLAVGDSADIETAYISAPELAVTRDPQRYTRITDREYLYQSRDGDFE